jgi:hypothetical protein
MNEQEQRRIQRQKEEMAQQDARARYQRVLDAWWEAQHEQEEWERRLHRELDPFNWGHWR